MQEKTSADLESVMEFLNAEVQSDGKVARQLRTVLREHIERHTATQGSKVLARLPLRLDLSGPAPTLVPTGDSPTKQLGRVVAAIASLPADQWQRLKICPAHDCEWIFYDSSRNRSRRWCSMQTCGNRAKVKAFRGREHS